MDIRQGPIGRAMGLKLVRIGTLGSTESWALRPGQAAVCGDSRRVPRWFARSTRHEGAGGEPGACQSMRFHS